MISNERPAKPSIGIYPEEIKHPPHISLVGKQGLVEK